MAFRTLKVVYITAYFERVEEFKYLGKAITNQNSIQEEIKGQMEVRECLLLFGAEFFVFQFANQKFKD